MMIKTMKVLTDIVFLSVLLLTVIFLLREVFGFLHLSRETGLLVVRLFVIGAPLSFVVSLVALFKLNSSRYKWYSWVSGVEVLVLALIYWIISSSQI